MQPEKLCAVGRADGGVKEGAVNGDLVGDRLPKLRGANAEETFNHEAREIGRPLEKDFCRRVFGDAQNGSPADCVR